MNFKISSHKIQHQIPSPSGIVSLDSHYYVIGDDSPFLFKLNTDFEMVSKYPIFPYDSTTVEGRIPKPAKPDFEALEKIGDNIIIGFGSGSKSPQREVFIHITINDSVSVERYPLTVFCNTLKKMDVLQGHELNIEAAAYFNNMLYIFNRGKNILFSIDYQEFINHIKGNSPCPAIESVTYTLPRINGIEAGFSGATTRQNGDLLLVTASVENTDNAYDDGEVLGSFIGAIPLMNGQPNPMIQWAPIDYNDTPLKVESILIEKEIGERNMDLVFVTDSDGGESLFLRGNLKW